MTDYREQGTKSLISDLSELTFACCGYDRLLLRVVQDRLEILSNIESIITKKYHTLSYEDTTKSELINELVDVSLAEITAVMAEMGGCLHDIKKNIDAIEPKKVKERVLMQQEKMLREGRK